MKDIKGYEGLYAVTSCGKVWSYRKKRFLKPFINESGYYIVDLCIDYKKKHHRVSRLVLETYNPVEGMERLDANHIDEDKSHNYLQNLNWMTHKENINHGTRNQRVSEARSKPVICIETGKIYPSVTEAAKAIGLKGCGPLSAHLNDRTASCKGLHWAWVDKEKVIAMNNEASVEAELTAGAAEMSREIVAV